MYGALVLLSLVTVLYAGYNLLINISSSHVPIDTSSTILATITLQVAALLVSCVFAAGLVLRGTTDLALPSTALIWAALAGLCIGTAEIGYFYLFRGGLNHDAVAASIAIPAIVGGTVLLTILVAWLFLQESMNWMKVFGAFAIVCGVVMLFVDGRS